MSLIGSLEDLGLGDILQIINLSQKSGVLSIRGPAGEGSIVFLDGMVRLAGLKGDPEDLRGLLVEAGFVSESDFEAARFQTSRTGVSLDVALEEVGSITAERIDSLRRERVENAVGEMFSWTSGEFSFDVGSDEDVGDNDLALSTGVNAQYLAMESLRVKDEALHASNGEEEPELNLDDLSAEEMFGVVPDPPEQNGDLSELAPTDSFADVVDVVEMSSDPFAAEARNTDPAMEAMVQFTADRVEPDLARGDSEAQLADPTGSPIQDEVEGEFLTAEIIDEPEGGLGAPGLVVSESGDELEVDPGFDSSSNLESNSNLESDVQPATEVCEKSTSVASPAIDRANLPPVVVIDPNLPVLEWARSTISDIFPQVHIFQRSQEGLGRIRQYLARAQAPLLLVSPEIEGNPLSGISDASDFVARLRSQAPRMPVIWMVSEESGPESAPDDDLKIVSHPSAPNLASGAGSRFEALGARAIEVLMEAISQSREGIRARNEGAQGTKAAPAAPANSPAPGLEHLKAATQALSDASNRGDVLPLVIRFAAESFQRVAMFMVRGDLVIGMAQSGLEGSGGPDDVEMRAIQFDRDECEFFREVIASGHSHTESARSDGDQRLFDYIGGSSRAKSYIAPIMSAEQVVALLYADNFASEVEPSDTSALEVVLHHAGLALDRAALERALIETGDE